jgi:hypothetical protein
MVTCEWYARCDHPAEGTVTHPIMGGVPTCQRCADRHSLDLHPPIYSAETGERMVQRGTEWVALS